MTSAPKIEKKEITVLSEADRVKLLAAYDKDHDAYTAGFARAARYLAFTSDLGEALRPVVSSRVVGGSYAIALVDVVKRITRKIGRFTRWGPSVAGLAIVPLLPLYLDHPVEHFLENMFEKHGPWAVKHPSAAAASVGQDAKKDL
eukprot:gene40938-50651_t